MKQDKKHLKRCVDRAEQIWLNIRAAILPMDLVEVISSNVEEFHKLMAEREEVLAHAFNMTNELYRWGAEGDRKDITDEELAEMGKCAEEAADNLIQHFVDVQVNKEEKQIKRALIPSEGEEKNARKPKQASKESNTRLHAGRHARGNKEKIERSAHAHDDVVAASSARKDSERE